MFPRVAKDRFGSARAACQGSLRNAFSSRVSRPLGVPTRQRTGASPSRVDARHHPANNNEPAPVPQPRRRRHR